MFPMFLAFNDLIIYQLLMHIILCNLVIILLMFLILKKWRIIFIWESKSSAVNIVDM